MSCDNDSTTTKATQFILYKINILLEKSQDLVLRTGQLLSVNFYEGAVLTVIGSRIYFIRFSSFNGKTNGAVRFLLRYVDQRRD